MASGGTVCVAIGDGSTYCMPCGVLLVAMPTARPGLERKQKNQYMNG